MTAVMWMGLPLHQVMGSWLLGIRNCMSQPCTRTQQRSNREAAPQYPAHSFFPSRAHLLVKSHVIRRPSEGQPPAAHLIPLKKTPGDGEAVTVRTREGSFIGKGFYNSRSSIRIRLYTRDKTEELDEGWLKRRISASVEFRNTFGKSRPARRLVWSEADVLSGLCHGPAKDRDRENIARPAFAKSDHRA
jgi:hypothetical protein